jgi:hypothetical protein
MKLEHLPPDIRKILDTKRQEIANCGLELTPEQLLASLTYCNDLCREHNHSIIDVKEALKRCSAKPPKPPYRFLFESQEEAQDFAERAKISYDVDCDINLIEFRRWELTSN